MDITLIAASAYFFLKIVFILIFVFWAVYLFRRLYVYEGDDYNTFKKFRIEIILLIIFGFFSLFFWSIEAQYRPKNVVDYNDSARQEYLMDKETEIKPSKPFIESEKPEEYEKRVEEDNQDAINKFKKME